MKNAKHHRSITVIAVMLLFFLVSCHHVHQGDVEILRFDKLLFETPAQELPSRLDAFCKQYPSPLLHIYPSDPQFMSELRGFTSDSTMRDIYKTTCQRYDDLSWLERELGEALDKACSLDSTMQLNHVAAYVSGVFDYDTRVTVDAPSRSALISLDQYAIPMMQRYAYFGLPLYIVNQCDSANIAIDIMAELARQHIAMPSQKDVTLLDLMIMEGKVLWFLDQVMPHKEDRLKIRYTEEQMKWCSRNEGMLWAYFIQQGLLYDKDISRFHNFIDEAPKTNAFKDSAPRTPQYLGWQIVRSYMSRNKCSLQQLFDNTDSQSILTASGYKP